MEVTKSYKTKEQVEEEFDVAFPESQYFENHARLSFEGADDKVKSFISTIRHNDVEAVKEMVKRMKKSYRQEDAWKCAVPHYNGAIDDILSELEALEKKI